MSDMNLFKAFSILINGADYQIGDGYIWKRAVFSTAVALTITFPLFNLASSLSYTGAVPPKAPLVQSAGRFTMGNYNRRASDRQRPINFHSVDGKLYQLLDIPLDPQKIRTANPRAYFYVEGFVLRDGSGFFWPTFVSDINGHLLFGQDESNKALGSVRKPFAREKLFCEYGLITPLLAYLCF